MLATLRVRVKGLGQTRVMYQVFRINHFITQNKLLICLRSEPTPAERASKDSMLQQEIKSMTERQRSRSSMLIICTIY